MAKGCWALVTGASAGIGAALAEALADEGWNLILVARSKVKLESLAARLEGLAKVQTHVVVADLSNEKDCWAVVDFVKRRSLDVALLINNAGVGVWGHFRTMDLTRTLTMDRLNVQAPQILTHALLPAMIAAKRGQILNVSSLAAFQAVVNYSTYAAGKAYLLLWSEALRYEVAPFGIKVNVLCPGPVDTDFPTQSGKGRGGFRAATAQSVASVVTATMKGLKKNKPLIVPSLKLKLYLLLLRLIPRQWVIKALAHQ